MANPNLDLDLREKINADRKLLFFKRREYRIEKINNFKRLYMKIV
jgi:hypothetical protein